MQKRQLTQRLPLTVYFGLWLQQRLLPWETERGRERRASIGRNLFTHIHYEHTQIIWQLTDWAIDWLPDRLTPPALLPPSDSNTLGQADSAIIWGEINVQRVQWHRLMANFSQYIEFALHDSPPHCCCQQQRHVFCQGQGQGHGQERSKGGGGQFGEGQLPKRLRRNCGKWWDAAEMPHWPCRMCIALVGEGERGRLAIIIISENVTHIIYLYKYIKSWSQ